MVLASFRRPRSRTLARWLVLAVGSSWLFASGVCAAILECPSREAQRACCHDRCPAAPVAEVVAAGARPCCAGAPALPSEPVRSSISTGAPPLATPHPVRTPVAPSLEGAPVAVTAQPTGQGPPLYLLLRSLLI